MATVMQHQGHTLEIETDTIEYSTALPQPDPKWTYTDRAGHGHAYGGSSNPYPTLARKHGEPYWCADCRDEHVDEWLECPQCGEKITPGTYIDTSVRRMPGLTSYLLDGRPITKEEAEAFLAEMRGGKA